MKKFYYKKDVEQEGTPILNRIERRKTLLELAKEVKSDQWHEMAVRTLSCSNSRQSEASKGTSNSSATSTFVVTDSDLASSWIYTSRREAANEVFEPNHQDLQLQEPNSSPTFSRSRSSLCTKICCRFSVATIITLCVIGIISIIGGILYLEVFAPRQTSVISSDYNNQPSWKLSGHHFTSENPDVKTDGPQATSSGRDSDSSNFPDYDKPSATVPSSSRKGKVLLDDQFPTPDVNLIQAYVNGTIKAMKNIFQKISDASAQDSNSRGRDLSSNFHEQNNSAYNGIPNFLRKLTSFLFGSDKSTVPSENNHASTVEESKIRSSPSNHKDQSVEVGSGDAADSSNLNENYLPWVSTSTDIGLFSKMRTLPIDLETPRVQDFRSEDDSLDLKDLFAKRNGDALEISPATQGIGAMDRNAKQNVRWTKSSAEMQNKASLSGDRDSAYSNVRKNVSASIAELFKIFKDIERMKSAVAIATSSESQESLVQVRLKDPGSDTDFGMNNNFTSEERNQYLQRLRNIVFNDDLTL